MISWNGGEVKHCTMFHPLPKNEDDQISIFMGSNQKYTTPEGVTKNEISIIIP